MTTIPHDYSAIMAAISAPENRNKFVFIRDGVTYDIANGYSVIYTPATGEIKICFSPTEKFTVEPTDTIGLLD